MSKTSEKGKGYYARYLQLGLKQRHKEKRLADYIKRMTKRGVVKNGKKIGEWRLTWRRDAVAKKASDMLNISIKELDKYCRRAINILIRCGGKLPNSYWHKCFTANKREREQPNVKRTKRFLLKKRV